MPSTIWDKSSPYHKAIVAVIGAVVAWVNLVILSPTEPITAVEWLTGATLVLTALGVYGTPNGPKPA